MGLFLDNIFFYKFYKYLDYCIDKLLRSIRLVFILLYLSILIKYLAYDT